MKVLLKAVVTTDSGEILSETVTNQFEEIPVVSQAPTEPVPAITNFQDQIIETFKTRGRLTRNEVRRLIHPERQQGGFPAFVNDFEKLVSVGTLKKCGENQRAGIYQLAVR